jgi:hypothetical protein
MLSDDICVQRLPALAIFTENDSLVWRRLSERVDVHKTLKSPVHRGSRFEPRLGRGFPHRADLPQCPLSLLYNGYRGFPGVKMATAWSCPSIPI